MSAGTSAVRTPTSRCATGASAVHKSGQNTAIARSDHAILKYVQPLSSCRESQIVCWRFEYDGSNVSVSFAQRVEWMAN